MKCFSYTFFFPSIQENRDVSITEVCHAIRHEIKNRIEESLKHLCYNNAKVGPMMCFKCDSCKVFHEVEKGKKNTTKCTANSVLATVNYHHLESIGLVKVSVTFGCIHSQTQNV